MRVTRRRLLASTAAGALYPWHADANLLIGARAPTPPLQSIIAVTPTSASFIGGAGSANKAVATFAAILNPTTPAFSGTYSLSGTDAAKFSINASSGLLSVGASDVAVGTYNINVIATEAGLGGSPFTQPVTIIATTATAIGYSVVVTLAGTGTYNSDGTVTGAFNGTVYTYNPDAPDSHTTATDLGPFVAPFAAFTQGCMHCVRDDTDLRVFFRKDVSPDPTRIEIILHLGKYRTNGSAADLGPFSLQILKGGVPQNIPVYTVSGAGNTWVPGGSAVTGFTNVTTGYFPQMGYWSRWRWNPTPRALVRTGSQLLPANLNLVPNYNQALGAAYGATPGGGTPAMAAYSSAANAGGGGHQSNYNPLGINEPVIITSSLGGVGDRPELGIVPEACADWIVNNTSPMQTTMLLLGEIDGGIPWHQADGTITGWGPHDFIAHPSYGWFSGNVGTTIAAPYTTIDFPSVPVPSANGIPSSGGNPTWGITDLYHTPALSYVAYQATGDPYYLENLQYKLSWLMGSNFYHRQGGYVYNWPDWTNQQSTAPFDQALILDGGQTRGRAWSMRDLAQCYLATPASVPSWLRPQSYYKSLSDLNQNYLDTWRATVAATYPELTTAIGNLAPFDDDYGYWNGYDGTACGFVLNQAGLSNWSPWVTFRSKGIVERSTGSTGWEIRETHQYGYFQAPFSTDYGVPTSKFTNYGDVWSYQQANAIYENGDAGCAWSTNTESNGLGSVFPTWQPSTAYHCNSWMVEFRGGCPVTPNLGDAVSLTIAGSFAGSPVTVSHTVTSGDNTTLIALVANNLSGTHPITADLISKINANANLNTAGIKAGEANVNSGVGSYQTRQQPGRFWISFNSDGTSSAGGPVIGAITVTGTYTPNGTPTTCSLYIQPNGDGSHNGFSTSAVLYHRALSYQCAQSGTSAASGGPTGAVLGSSVTDGTCKWYYVPERKSQPIFCPGSFLTAGRSGFGGGYSPYNTNPGYIFQSMAGLACLTDASVTNASLGRNNLKAMLDDYYTQTSGPSSAPQRWGFAIAPAGPPPPPSGIGFTSP